MSVRRCAAAFSSLALLAGLLFSGGCASQPPNQNTLSGKRLIVDMTFAGSVDPNLYYFFLINKVGDVGQQGANGPLPVIAPPYGNGIATGPAGTQGYTDYVEFDSRQPLGYGLHHVLDWSKNNTVYVSPPISYLQPSSNLDDLASTRLHFELDLSQLIVDANGKPLTDQASAVTQARNIRWIQVNIVTTNSVPVDATTAVDKRVDALGNTSTGTSNWFEIDLSQFKIYQNSDFVGQSIYEPPSTSDVYPLSLDAIDLRDWKIEVRQE